MDGTERHPDDVAYAAERPALLAELGYQPGPLRPGEMTAEQVSPEGKSQAFFVVFEVAHVPEVAYGSSLVPQLF